MLQRIYGTAWKNHEDLTKHLDMLKEAEKKRPSSFRECHGFVSFSRGSSWFSFLAPRWMDVISNSTELHEERNKMRQDI